MYVLYVVYEFFNDVLLLILLGFQRVLRLCVLELICSLLMISWGRFLCVFWGGHLTLVLLKYK